MCMDTCPRDWWTNTRALQNSREARSRMPPEEPLPEPAAFLTKTYEMVDDSAVDDVISWTEDGSAFVVRETVEFARDLLPSKFKHSNFTSFLRQLYAYGFRKVSPDRWEFANELFRRGKKPLLNDVCRRKNPSLAEECGFSSTELVDENRRLRRENVELKREVWRIKKVIDGVTALMSTYAPGHQPAPEEEEEEASTRLFGVEISVRGTEEKSKPSGRGSNLRAE